MYTDPQQNKALEPELDQPAPRPARYTTFTQVARAIGLGGWLFMTVLLFTLAVRDIGDLRGLLATGKMMNAVIYDKYTRSGKHTSYHLQYQYTLDRVPYTGDESVSSNVYYNTPIGARLPITFLPENPAIHRVGQVTKERVDTSARNWIVGIGIACTLLALFLAYIETTSKKQLTMLQYGIATLGTVTGKDARRSGKSTVYSVAYSFHADGSPVWKSMAVPYDVYEGLYPGMYFTVLYMPGNPKDNMPYKAIRSATL